ncbi:MAG TPA: methyltransferase [Pyrinomonadaceae bacterium]|nr:methyltransferase [Pyrinomonadaceae bacterium]
MNLHADASLIRALGLLVPLCVASALWAWRKPARRPAAAALLACVWNLPALLVVQLLAVRFGWWHFEARGGLLLGMPVDLYLGWVLLWGAIPLLAFPRVPFGLMAAIMLGVDLCLMPACRPVVELGERWLVGEGVALALCLVPSQLLARWTLRGRHLARRATLQMLAFGGLMFGLLPAVIIEQTGGGWSQFLERPAWLNGLALQLLALPAVVGLSALQEFVTRGRGTPLPYDPPQRLVTSGVYSYVANPMQLATCLLLAGWGVFLGSVWVACAGVMCVVYGAGIAAWDEGGDLKTRFGADWLEYRRAVPLWWPRWRPFRNAGARLYVAESCGMCAEVARWLKARRPVALEIVAAEDHPARDLRRMTYETGDGHTTTSAEGVAAFARALEHLNFGWAFAACAIRLPLVCEFVQLLVDAAGGGPRLIRRRRAGVTCSVARSRD